LPGQDIILWSPISFPTDKFLPGIFSILRIRLAFGEEKYCFAVSGRINLQHTGVKDEMRFICALISLFYVYLG